MNVYYVGFHNQIQQMCRPINSKIVSDPIYLEGIHGPCRIVFAGEYERLPMWPELRDIAMRIAKADESITVFFN